MTLLKPGKKGIPGIHLLYLIIGLVILGLVIINIVINLIWLSSFAERLEERVTNYLLTEARRAAESIEGFINTELEDIKRLSQDLVVAKDPGFFIDRFLKKNPSIKEISIINLDGQEQQRYSRAIYFTKADLRNFSFLEEFEKAKQGETFISKIEFTAEAEPYVKITTPIRKSEMEKPEAVLRAVFYLKGIWGEIIEMKIGETGRISVVDDKGMLIADPNPSRVLKKTNLLTLPPTKPLIMGEVFKGTKYFNEKEIKVLGVGAPIKSLRWGVIVEQEIREVEALSKEVITFTRVFLIAGIIVIGLLVSLVIVIKRTNQDLMQKSSALEIKTRELEEAKTILEIKVRARTRELRELAEGLEDEVKRRTAEVQERIKELERFHRLAVGRELKMIELKKEIKKLKKQLKIKSKTK